MRQRSAGFPLHRIWVPVLIFGCLVAVAFVIDACSSSTTTTASGMSTVHTMISDPATCQAPNGPYSHVYVTITDVQANTSATAGNTDSGWADLTPGLSKQPMQIDLLGQANNKCFLATLGDNLELQAGNYQQIRLMLASTAAGGANNPCGTAANCVVLSSDNSAHTLQLSSEAQTGIKIPSGQIASGGFNIAAGQTKDLDIDFDTCDSIVQEGNGQYRLKPVLHAGEVSTTSNSINGTIVDSVTGNPVNGKVMISLEQKDSGGVDRVMMSTMAGTDGTFVFCNPMLAGTFDVVVVGTRNDGVVYQPSIVTGVSVGSTAGTVKLYLPANTATSTATLTGQVTSQNSSNQGIAADVQLSTLESVGTGTTPPIYTIPLPPTSTQNAWSTSVTTAATPTPATPACTTGTYCANYSLTVPSGGVYLGAWSSTGASLTASAPLATYVVDGTTTACSPLEIKSSSIALAGTGPFSASASTLAFVQCQ